LPIDFTPLRKVLELEHKKDYSDSAVIGGLDKFLAKWVAQAEGTITEPKLLNSFYKLNLNKIKYASLNREQRRQRVKDILSFLAEAEQGTGKRGEASLPSIPSKTSPKPRTRQPQPVLPLIPLLPF